MKMALFILLLFPFCLSAQTASLGGRVIDSATGEPLEGVHVSISPSAEATSDEFGVFRFHQIPAGEHALLVRMPGYTSLSVPVMLGTGDQSVNPIRLEQDLSVAGDRIFSEARRREQAQGLSRSRESLNFSSIITNRQMETFGDRTVQDAVVRLAGVQSGRHGEINIRGTGFNRFNVMLNGRRMATTGFGNRSVDLSGLSADIVQQLELIRVVTPDMAADAEGGVINIRTRRPAGQRAVSAYGGFGAQPAYYSYGGADVRTGLHYSEALREDLSVGLNLNYQQDYFGWESLGIESDVDDFGEGRTDVIRRVTPSLHANRMGRLAGGLHLDFTPNDRTVLHLNGFYNEDDRTLDHHRNYWDTGGDWIRPDTTGATGSLGSYGYEASRRDHRLQQYAVQAVSRHRYDRMDLMYNASWSAARVRQQHYLFPFMRQGLDFSIDTRNPDRPVLHPTNIVLKRDGTIDYRVIRFQDLERTINDHTDNTFYGNVDLEIPLGTASVKLGSDARMNLKRGDYRETVYSYTRSLDLYRFKLIPLGAINIFDEDAYYIPWLLDTEGGRRFLEDNTPSFNKNENLERRNSDIWNYDHTENIFSGYGMGTFRLGSLHVLGGLRLEHTLATYRGRSVDFDEGGALTESRREENQRQYTSFFPNAQLAFKPTDEFAVRLALSRTIARPDYNRLSPFTLTHRQDSVIFRGNPDLEPMTSDNLDLMADYHFSGLGHIGIGLFYKRLSDFTIERSRVLADGEFAGFQEHLYENAREADLYGVEVSWQQNLTFLPGILGNFGTYATYTWTGSVYETDFRQDEVLRLPGQSPHTVNAALNYTQGRMFGQVSWHWTAEYLTDLAGVRTWVPAAGTAEQLFADRFEDGASDLRVHFGFRISEKFRFWADASNLLRNERIHYIYSRTAYPAVTDLRQGLTFRSGFRFNL